MGSQFLTLLITSKEVIYDAIILFLKTLYQARDPNYGLQGRLFLLPYNFTSFPHWSLLNTPHISLASLLPRIAFNWLILVLFMLPISNKLNHFWPPKSSMSTASSRRTSGGR